MKEGFLIGGCLILAGLALLWVLIVAFVLLQMCWWGINYLPSAQATSVHSYN
jgi:hypothetical protein